MRGTAAREQISGLRTFLHFMLEPTSLPVPASSLLSAAELQAYVDMFRWSGGFYALLWYRANLTRLRRETGAGAGERGSGQRDSERITVPALMMTADRDRVLRPVMAEGMEGWCDKLSRVALRQAGHWAQLEQTEQVNSAIAAFLAQL